MATRTILNARRSTDMCDYVNIKVDMYVEEEVMRLLESKMLEFTKLHARNFMPACQMDITEMGINNMINYRFSVPFRGNWQDGGKRWANRTAYLFELKRNITELGIKFEMPVQKVSVIQ
jgi:hypothetical protein